MIGLATSAMTIRIRDWRSTTAAPESPFCAETPIPGDSFRLPDENTGKLSLLQVYTTRARFDVTFAALFPVSVVPSE